MSHSRASSLLPRHLKTLVTLLSPFSISAQCICYTLGRCIHCYSLTMSMTGCFLNYRLGGKLIETGPIKERGMAILDIYMWYLDSKNVLKETSWVSQSKPANHAYSCICIHETPLMNTTTVFYCVFNLLNSLKAKSPRWIETTSEMVSFVKPVNFWNICRQ